MMGNENSRNSSGLFANSVNNKSAREDTLVAVVDTLGENNMCSLASTPYAEGMDNGDQKLEAEQQADKRSLDETPHDELFGGTESFNNLRLSRCSSHGDESGGGLDQHDDSLAELVGTFFKSDDDSGRVNTNSDVSVNATTPSETSSAIVQTAERLSKQNNPLLPPPHIILTRASESENVDDNLFGSPPKELNVFECGTWGKESDEEDDISFPREQSEITDDESLKYFSPRQIKNGKVLGEGGFGRVLRGSLVGGTPVAIKLFHAPFSGDPTQLDKLLTLKHKNIVAILGFVREVDSPDVDCPQLVLQYVSEGNVLHFISKHENPEDSNTLGKIALDIVQGCEYLHECGVVHGNLAARNVLIECVVGRHKTYYNAKLSDASLIQFAEALGGNYMKIGASDRAIPVRWVPKEIIEEGEHGQRFTCQSDVWSFGVVLWEMWTRGAIPYGASYSNLRVIQFLKDGFSPLKVHRPTDCPPKIIAVMESIFQVDPNKRPTFHMITQHFKNFRGYGIENKFKGSRPTVPKTLPQLSAAEDGDELGAASGEQTNPKSQDGKLKKKKIKKNKKVFQVEHKISGAEVGAYGDASQGGAETVLPTIPHQSPQPTYKNKGIQPVPASYPQQVGSTDSTIAALLKRVHQLEKQKRGGGGGPSSIGAPNTAKRWQKKMGPPRFRGRGGYHHHEFREESGGASILTMQSGADSGATPPPPPVTLQAPPPYTEDPLPNHSAPHYNTPLPEYDYSHNPGPSRARGTRGVYNSVVAVTNSPATSRVGGEEDYIRQIKRLAEEIEVLRAEKMTQELLKKSAELAVLMKVMTSPRREHMFNAQPSYTGNGGSSGVVVEPAPLPTPHHLGGRGGARYMDDEYDSYQAQAYQQGRPDDGRWTGQDERSRAIYRHHSPALSSRGGPPSTSRHTHPQHSSISASSQRGSASYYRKGGRYGHRGYHRYNDGDDTNHGPY